MSMPGRNNYFSTDAAFTMGESENIRSSSYHSMVSKKVFESFEESKQPGAGFYSFVLIYTLVAFLLIAPLVSWSRNKEEKKLKIRESDEKQVEKIIEHHKNPDHQRVSTDDSKQRRGSEETASKKTKTADQEKHSRVDSVKISSSSIGSDSSDILAKNSRHMTSKTVISSSRSRKSASLRSVVQRELDQSYPDQDPDFQNRIALRFSLDGILQQSFQNNIQHNNNTNTNDVRRDQQQILQYTENNNNGDGRSGGGSNQPTEASSSVPSATTTGSNQPTETSSSVPSAATTGQIHQNTTAKKNPSNKGFSKLVLDVGGRRWKNRRPIGRADVIENAFASNSVRHSPSITADNTNKKGGSLATPDPKKTSNSLKRGGQSGIPQLPNHQQRQSKIMSDVASSILSESHHRLNNQPQIQIDISLLEQLRLQQQHQTQHQLQFFAMHRLQQQQRRYSQQRRYGRFGPRSVSERSASVMSSIVDDISPDDAPDANDPGRGNVFIQPDEKYLVPEIEYDHRGGSDFGPAQEGCCLSPIEAFLSLFVPDVEKWNVLQASIPLTLGASSEALFRLVTIAFIAQKLGTEDMIAFLLVGLFVRLTSEELSSAIIDSLSSFVQASMDRTSIDTIKSNYIAGQYIQLAFVLQVVLNIPLLVFWVYFMEDFVIWLVVVPTIAKPAQLYASRVVYAYIVQALSRTLTVVFHICGHEHFESVIDLVSAALQVIAIACVVTLVDRADLKTVGSMQVVISVASALAKIAYPVARGWMAPFRKGLIQNVALWNYRVGVWHLLKAAAPLLLGTVLEYGEWELLTLFIRHLGPFEVATWALLGAFWDFFEALTEGIGEAAANQITYLLSVGRTDCAKKLCHGAILMAVTQAVLVTSALYMSGQYLAVLFTTHPVMQHMLNDTIVLIGFANVIMAFSQITWSLIGAQGRFRLATFVIFFSRWMVTMPCALVSIYLFGFNLNAVSGSLVVGCATACCALTVIVLTSDWDRLSRLMQVMNQPPLLNSTIKDIAGVDDVNFDDRILGLVDLDNFDDSDDDSDGFGFGDYGDDGDDGKDSTDPTASVSRKKRREIDKEQNLSQSKNSSMKSKS